MKSIKHYLIIVTITTLFLTYSVIVEAQTGKSKIYNSITFPQIVSIMKSKGYAVEPNEANKVVAWRLDTGDSVISADKPNTLIFYAYAKGSTATPKEASTWNYYHKYSKTYFNDDKDAVLELFLIISGGVTEARIRDFFKTCEISHMEWINKFEPKPGAKK
jgi:hypothetical protein